MGTLFVVGTPIGNLSDMSPRAQATLANVDFIAAEDTRVSRKLTTHFGIKTPYISYYEHNREMREPQILARLQNGESCALVTDAGMPAISDPGTQLIKLCRENGIKVEAVPGATAFATAMAVSGINSRRFCFEGFLDANKKRRAEHLNMLKNETRTMLFYEAPHRLTATLREMTEAFGENREIAVCRELTKLHEQVINTTTAGGVEYFTKNEPQGEFVIVVCGGEPCETRCECSEDEAVNEALSLMRDGMPASKAAKRVAASTGYRRSEIYKRMMETDEL